MLLPDKDRADPQLIHARGAHRSERDSWNSLKLFLLYRLGISLVLLLLHSFGALPIGFNHTDQTLFLMTAQSLFVINCLLIPVVFLAPIPFRHLVSGQVFIDIIAFALMMYSSSGLESGIGLLVVPSIAGASLLLPGNMAPFYAAFATLAVFVQAGLSILHGKHEMYTLTQAGIQGSIFFAVAILATKMARKALASEELAYRRGQDFADLAQLNRHIVEQMDTGVIVVGDDDRVRLINKAAWTLLGESNLKQPLKVAELSPILHAGLSHWLVKRQADNQYFKATARNGREFQAQFVPIGSGKQRATLIYLQDLTERSRQLHEVKLAALGRLTASIAHEIRNPLGAISHASQLLQESDDLSDPDKRLTHIIQSNTQRMNQLIENVLNLSRRKTPDIHPIALHSWLSDTVDEYRRQHDLRRNELTLKLKRDITIEGDAGQLHQVLWNLLRNAQIHATGQQTTTIRIEADCLPGDTRATIDIINGGDLIREALRERLFEPFFSTAGKGTGLGLYLARELCEANRGTLEYIALPGIGNCFRVKIPLAAK